MEDITPRIAERNQNFMNCSEQIIKHREKNHIELRKRQKFHEQQKRRMTDNLPQMSDSEFAQFEANLTGKSVDQPLSNRLRAILELFNESNEPGQIYQSLQYVRKQTSEVGYQQQIYNEIHQLNYLPWLLRFCDYQVFGPEITIEATWILCNMASFTSQITLDIINLQGMQVMMQALTSNDATINEHAVWTMGNMLGNSPQDRSRILTEEILQALWKNLERVPQSSQITAWTLTNCIRGLPRPSANLRALIYEILNHLATSTDVQTLKEVLWGISYACHGDVEHMQEVIDSGLLQHCFKMMDYQQEQLAHPAIRALGHISVGSDTQMDYMLSNNILTKLQQTTFNTAQSVIKEALWLLSNILAGPAHHITLVLDRPIVVQYIFKSLSHANPQIRNEASYAVRNLSQRANYEHMQKLASSNIFLHLSSGLGFPVSMCTFNILQFCEAILTHFATTDMDYHIKTWFDQTYLLEKIEKLQQVPNDNLNFLVLRIIDNHFGREETNGMQVDGRQPPVFNIG